MTTPETRTSLLLRIRDPADADAWDEFATLYRETIARVGRLRGMSPHDTDDLVQNVLIAVSTAVERFDPDGPARFSTWLQTVARNAAVNALVRGVRHRGPGGTDALDLLAELPSGDALTQTLSLDYRRGVFQAAADRVRDEVHEDTWRAFWQTAVVGRPVDEVAAELGRTPGSVHTARSRVIARLRTQVQRIQSDPS